MSVKLKGIDVSAWQGTITVDEFKKAKKSGVDFAILRLGYTGSSSKKPTLDNYFEQNYKNARSAGLPVGIYFYSLATTKAKAEEEASFVLKHIKNKIITWPVYIDVEDPTYQSKCSKSTLANVCNTFCNEIKRAGYETGVYASLSWFNNKIGNIVSFASIWVAQYYSKCQYKKNYDMWQYSSSENVPGIASHTDVSWCYKDFRKDTPQPTPTPEKETYSGTFPTFELYLEKGDKGTQVKYLQKFLNWALDLKLNVDGEFGTKTLKAVKQFQEKTGISVDGKFGKTSLKKAKTFKK